MRPVLCLLLALLPATVFAGPVYKHTDAHGNVVYTDQPPEGAEEISLPPVNTMSGHLPPEQSAPAAPAPEFTGYESLLIAGVGDGEVLQNPEGTIVLNAAPSPELQDGHRILLTLNGERVSESGSFELPEAPRGEYLVGATVVDDRDNVLIEAAPVRFQIQQQFIRPKKKTK